MKEKVVRIRISEDTFKKYKLLCVEMDLSIPKQTEQLINNFITVQSDNLNKIRNIGKGK